jgi:membrane-associated protease RseP (regulator of RpoE activity)
MGRMAAEVGMVLRGESRTHRFLRARLTFLAMATVLVDAVGTVAMYGLEHDARRTGFHTVGGALFWVSAQLTTVSSQLPNPVTTGGRIVDLMLEAWAISAVATLAASLAAFFRARHVEEGP